MRFKKIGIWSAVILMLIISCVISGSAASSKFAAKVNGVGVKNSTLDAAVSNFVENQKTFGVDVKEEDKEKLRNGILEELISAELLYQESKKADLGDLKQDIEQQFGNIKNGFPSEDEFKKILNDNGVSEKELKEDIKKGVYINAFLEKTLYKDVAISEADKKKEYENNEERLNLPEQVKASHILIRVQEDAAKEDRDKAREKIDDLRKRAGSGEDFGDLAKENSEDGSASNGGDLGFFGKGMMVPSFEEVAFSLEKGKISDVIETQFGYHIIKVTDKQDARKLTYEEVEPDIVRFLTTRKKEDMLAGFVDEIKKTAKIEMY